MAERICTRCGNPKPLADFGPRPGGLKSACRQCLADVERERYKDPSVRAAKLEVNRLWAERNPDVSRAIKRRWDQRNPDRGRRGDQRLARERRHRWAVANRAAVAEKSRRRRARIAHGTTAEIPTELLAAKIAYWDGRCWMCGETADNVDHVKPIAAGGPHLLANLRPACQTCNRRKGAKWPYPSSSRGPATAPTAEQPERGSSTATAAPIPNGTSSSASAAVRGSRRTPSPTRSRAPTPTPS